MTTLTRSEALVLYLIRDLKESYNEVSKELLLPREKVMILYNRARRKVTHIKFGGSFEGC